MSAWVTVPCLLALRDEFNAVSPHRDKGADGTIGDSAHTSSSDHTPDEDSDVLRGRDADSVNEVHALDIDSSGPWPGDGWFNRTILALVERERAEYESPTIVGRLQYVIWNHRIASRSWGWSWRGYDGDDPHTNHAHFSARYTSGQEADTRPWGVYEEDDMLTADEIARKTWEYVLDSPALGVTGRPAGDWLKIAQAARNDLAAVSKSLTAAIQAVAAKDQVDERALAAELAPAVAAAVVASLPTSADDISQEEVTAAVEAAFARAFGSSTSA